MSTEQRTTIEQRRALRARYAPEPVPGCPHCGGKRALSWAFEPRLQMHLYRCATPECRERRPDTDTLASTGDQGVLALCDDADALAGALAEVGRLRAKAETVIDVLDKMKSLAAHAEEMTPMLTEAAIWWGDMAALVEEALGCAERMTAPEREGASDALA